jgi:hypothetical protein
VAFGIPLAVCSCGVVPLYQTLILQGVPATAGMAFLVATPELGIDSVMISLPLLGLDFTIVRLVCAGAGRDRGRHGGGSPRGRSSPTPAAPTAFMTAHPTLLGGCARACASGSPRSSITHRPGSCSASRGGGGGAGPQGGLDHRAALGRGRRDLRAPRHAALRLRVGRDAVRCGPHPQRSLAGAALAFLLTGPATNVTTFGILSQLHGRRIALLFGGMMAALTIGLGLLVNTLMPDLRGIAVGSPPATSPACSRSCASPG